MRQFVLLSAIHIGFMGNLQRASGQCADLMDSLESLTTIVNAGGVISGVAGFAPAVCGNGITLAGNGFVSYSASAFNAPSGSVTMWVRKNATDYAGGLFQIGILGQSNSIGLAYENDCDLIFKAFALSGSAATIQAGDALSADTWMHCAAVWRREEEQTELWLFLDGRYVGYDRLYDMFDLSAGQMQIGVSGVYGLANARIDELRFFSWRLTDDEVYAEYVVSAHRHRPMVTAKPQSTGAVQVSGKMLLVNGLPFSIKGVAYQPTPIGAPITGSIIDMIYTDAQILSRDTQVLRAMGANTIRTWSQPPDQRLLDACYNGGIQPIWVIVGFWVPQEPGVNYSDPATLIAIETAFRGLVNQFKSHPALLAWGIGNENNLTYTRPLSEWYALANHLAATAYEIEGNAYHPCLVINGGLRDLGDTLQGSDDLAMNMIDIWGVNFYPGASFHCSFSYFDEISQKPLIATEFGIDALDNRVQAEYLSTHAEWVLRQWLELRDGCLGGTVMAYSDEWWKAGSPSDHDSGGYYTAAHPDGFSNEEWWGIVRPVDNGSAADVIVPRQAYYELANAFLGPPGDMNCDGFLALDDMDLFVRALMNPDDYAQLGLSCPTDKADLNSDSIVNGLDIAGFVTALTYSAPQSSKGIVVGSAQINIP